MVDGTPVCSRCGSTKALNVTLLDAAIASGPVGISLEEMEQVILERMSEKSGDMNVTILRMGAVSERV